MPKYGLVFFIWVNTVMCKSYLPNNVTIITNADGLIITIHPLSEPWPYFRTYIVIIITFALLKPRNLMYVNGLYWRLWTKHSVDIFFLFLWLFYYIIMTIDIEVTRVVSNSGISDVLKEKKIKLFWSCM